MSGPGGQPSASLAALSELLGLQSVTHPISGSPGSPAHTTQLGLIQGRNGPRFLVPVGYPDAAPETCLAYLGLRDRRTRPARGAVGWALKAGLGPVVARTRFEADTSPGSLIAWLDELLHDPMEEPGLAVAAGVGPVDQVWKPTLQVFRPDGEPAAFVKVGRGAVAADLVATEIRTLRAWEHHPDPRIVVPRLVAASTWNDMPIAVLAPLPTDSRRLPSGPTSAWPVRDLDGPVVAQGITDAPWWADRRQQWSDRPELDELLERIEHRHRHRNGLRWGRSHGDWVPWNLARCHRGLVAWDWEYSEAGAPVGLDEAHGAYQHERVVRGRSILEALTASRAATAAAAGPDASWLADAHLAMLVTRAAKLEVVAQQPAAHWDELLTAARSLLAPDGPRLR